MSCFSHLFMSLVIFCWKPDTSFRRTEMRKIDFMFGKTYTCWSARILVCKMSQELGWVWDSLPQGSALPQCATGIKFLSDTLCFSSGSGLLVVSLNVSFTLGIWSSLCTEHYRGAVSSLLALFLAISHCHLLLSLWAWPWGEGVLYC